MPLYNPSAQGGGVTNSAPENAVPMSDASGDLVDSFIRYVGDGVYVVSPGTGASTVGFDLIAGEGGEANLYAETLEGGLASLDLKTPDGRFSIGVVDDGAVLFRTPTTLAGMDFSVQNTAAGSAIALRRSSGLNQVTLGDVADGANLTKLVVDDGDQSIKLAASKHGFFGGTPVTRPEVPATPTEQDIVDVLVALGLITQAAP